MGTVTTHSLDAIGDARLNRGAKSGGANAAVEVSLWEEFAAADRGGWLNAWDI